jgi:NAD-dependent dihydropyrimidine dehydrogenase PreA subunit/nitroreductase
MGLLTVESPVPVIDRERCTNCGLCARVCPSDTLVFDRGQVRIDAGIFTGCIGCGQCMMVCPGGSIRVSGRGLDPDDLVDLPPPAMRATPEQFDAFLLARRSIRTFRDSPVGRNVIERILAMTATAPVGIPPSEVGIVVLHGRDKVRSFVSDAVAAFRRMKRFFHPAVLLLMRLFQSRADNALLRNFVRPLLTMIVQRWDAGEDVLFHDAPAALLFHSGPGSDPADVHIAATYAMLAAHSLGLGSCLIGTTVALNHVPSMKATCGIPEANQVSLGLILGYPPVVYHRSIRRPLASVHYL